MYKEYMYTMKINCSKNSHFNYILYYNTICELYVNYITNKPNSAFVHYASYKVNH